MARTIAVANQKGGVGKTTTVINLGASLAALEQRVAIIDFDPQGNSSSGLGASKGDPRPNIYQALSGDITLAEAMRPTAVPFLDLVSSSRDLVGAEVELVAVPDREFVLKRLLASIQTTYRYILIDSPPSLGLLTLNALSAADSVLIPIQCEYFALEGVSELLETIERVRDGLNPFLGIEGVLLTMYDERTNLCRQVAEDIRNYFKEQVFKVTIPRNIKLGEAPSFGKSILSYDIKSKGAESYIELAREIRERER